MLQPPLYLFLSSGSIYRGYSKGDGYFYERAAHPAYSAAFSIIKIRSTGIVLVRTRRPELRWFLQEVLPLSPPYNPQVYFPCSPKDILSHYWPFKLLFWQLDHQAEWAQFMPVIRLFVQGFLVEKSVWESFDLGQLYQRGILVASHWQEMEGISIGRDLSDCERLFGPEDANRSSREPTRFQLPLEHSPYRQCLARLNHQYLSSLGPRYLDSRLEWVKHAATTDYLGALVSILSLTKIPLRSAYDTLEGLAWHFPDRVRGGYLHPHKLLDDFYCSAAKAGRTEIIKWLMSRFSVPPSRLVIDTAAYHGQQNVLDCLAASGISITRFWQPSRDLEQRVLRRRRWVEKNAIRETMRKAFYAEHEAFLRHSNDEKASGSLSDFAGLLLEPEKVWKKGFQSIRRLLDNEIPSGVQDIFACIQVSRAMRACLSQNFDTDDQECADQTSADLVRWRCALAQVDHDLFDEIVTSIWKQDLSTCDSQSNWQLCNDTLLEHFRSSFERLIASTRMACLFSGDEISPIDGRRLCDIQDDFTSDLEEADSEGAECPSIPQTFDTSDLDPEPYPRHQDQGIVTQPVVILLAATTIFMTIVAFFIGMFCHHGFSRV